MSTSENLLKISREFDFIDFNNYFLSHSVNEKWSILESDLLALLNKIAPEKNIVIKSQDSFPWIDDDLKYIQYLRDLNYKKWKLTDKTNDFLIYKDLRSLYDKNYNSNMIEYFKILHQKILKIQKNSGNSIQVICH